MATEDNKNTKHTHSPSIQTFIDQIAPLVLDAFVMHLWLHPLLSILLKETPIHGGTGLSTGIVVVCTVMTFVVNMTIYPHLMDIHMRYGVCDSPLFRSIWIFISSSAARRYTGGGAMPFTIVTFIPLMYVRVPNLMHVISCLYGIFFFVVTITRNIFMIFGGEATLPNLYEPSKDNVYQIGFCWFVYIFTSIFHPIFMSSQMYNTERFKNMNHCNGVFMWELSGIRIAIFRSLVVVFTAFLYDRDFIAYMQKDRHSIQFMETLFLYMTITTFTSWVHCQHVNPNTISNILTSSVVAASCGMIVDNIEQTALLCTLTPFAIAFDIYNVRIKDWVKPHKE